MKILFFGNANGLPVWVNSEITAKDQLYFNHALSLQEVQVMLKLIAFDAVIYDISGTENHCREEAGQLLKIVGRMPVIVLTGPASLEAAVAVVKLGAGTYLLKEQSKTAQVMNAVNMVISKKFDYIKRFSMCGVIPQPLQIANKNVYSF